MNIKTVFITGATGVMGYETLKAFAQNLNRFEIRLLVRPSKKNRKKLSKFIKTRGITVIWGDLMNPEDIRNAMGNAEYVLHLGGMVSPLADHFPEKTLKVNVGAIHNIIQVIKERHDKDNVKLVYIGSVAQTSNRMPPYHWGRIGDPVAAAKFDYYGVSKIKAEWLLAESGLKYWVSLRQTGILHKGLVFKGSDPISFHVPLQGVLEWATVEDSARLMVNLCSKDNLHYSFWRNFYNIGSGEAFRLTNYEFEKKLMNSLGCPPPEKVFDRNWFATRNFHGQWYEDSDSLNEIFQFREGISADEYFKRLAKQMPWWTRLAPLAPSFLIKSGMKRVALTKDLGTLDWLRRKDCDERINAFFGSREKQANIGNWKTFDSTPPSSKPMRLSHGFDESKNNDELDKNDIRQAARFRGGTCDCDSLNKGEIDTPVQWQCGMGHKFTARPRTILRGGHWCPECAANWNYEKQAEKNRFLAQIFPSMEEN